MSEMKSMVPFGLFLSREFLVYDETPEQKAARESQEAAAKKFSQEDVNRFLAEEKRKAQQKNQELVTQLESLKSSAGLTQQERDALQTRIENLQSEHLTDKQRAEQAIAKANEKYEKDTKKLSDEVKRWQGMYTDSTIVRTITDAAVAAEAFHPSQIVAILRNNTRLAEALDEKGSPTGELIPKVKYEDTDKEGKSVTLDLTVPEAVKRMIEAPNKYGNLFKGQKKSGTGEDNGTGKSGAGGQPPSDPTAYRTWRKNNPL